MDNSNVTWFLLLLRILLMCLPVKGCTTGMVLIGSEKFKVFDSQNYTWEAARLKCNREGLVMAELQDPSGASIITQYLVENYSGCFFWLGAAGNGKDFVWNSGIILPISSPFWYGGSIETHKLNYCLVAFHPNKPYHATRCGLLYGALCQCDIEGRLDMLNTTTMNQPSPGDLAAAGDEENEDLKHVHSHNSSVIGFIIGSLTLIMIIIGVAVYIYRKRKTVKQRDLDSYELESPLTNGRFEPPRASEHCSTANAFSQNHTPCSGELVTCGIEDNTYEELQHCSNGLAVAYTGKSCSNDLDTGGMDENHYEGLPMPVAHTGNSQGENDVYPGSLSPMYKNPVPNVTHDPRYDRLPNPKLYPGHSQEENYDRLKSPVRVYNKPAYDPTDNGQYENLPNSKASNVNTQDGYYDQVKSPLHVNSKQANDMVKDIQYDITSKSVDYHAHNQEGNYDCPKLSVHGKNKHIPSTTVDTQYASLPKPVVFSNGTYDYIRRPSREVFNPRFDTPNHMLYDSPRSVMGATHITNIHEKDDQIYDTPADLHQL